MRITKFGWALVGMVVVKLAVIGGLGYVAAHFIRKYW